MNRIITSNMYLGADNQGIKEGINVLKQNNILGTDSEDLMIHSSLGEDTHKGKMKYYFDILEHLKDIYQTYVERQKENRKNILIGGDHSISIASVAHSLETNENLGVIWIDAHADINTDQTTNSGNVHGMTVASLLGLGDNGLAHFVERSCYLSPENIVYIGLRDVEPKEQALLDELGINYYTFADVQKIGAEKIMEETIEYLTEKQVSALHISYDLDSADPTIVPGVSTPVVGGLTLYETVFILEQLCNHFDIAAMDIVEFNPENDKEEKTLEFIEVIIACAKSWIKELNIH